MTHGDQSSQSMGTKRLRALGCVFFFILLLCGMFVTPKGFLEFDLLGLGNVYDPVWQLVPALGGSVLTIQGIAGIWWCIRGKGFLRILNCALQCSIIASICILIVKLRPHEIGSEAGLAFMALIFLLAILAARLLDSTDGLFGKKNLE